MQEWKLKHCLKKEWKLRKQLDWTFMEKDTDHKNTSYSTYQP